MIILTILLDIKSVYIFPWSMNSTQIFKTVLKLKWKLKHGNFYLGCWNNVLAIPFTQQK